MEQGKFKGFQDIVIRDGLWSFKGENVWSGDITELWKYIKLSIEQVEHKHQVSMQCARDGAREEILQLLKNNIKSVHKDLLFSRTIKNYRKDWIEGFRSRLDGFLLLWHEIHDISFIDACKEFGIKYEDVDTETSESHTKEKK